MSLTKQPDVSYTLYRTTDYLKFYQGMSESGKTKRLLVYAVRDLALLGEIKWFSRWRQYAFFPVSETVWNRDCLTQIHEEIETLTAERATYQGGADKP